MTLMGLGERVHDGKEAIRQALEGFLAMKPNITLDTKTLAQTADVALCTPNGTLLELGLTVQWNWTARVWK